MQYHPFFTSFRGVRGCFNTAFFYTGFLLLSLWAGGVSLAEPPPADIRVGVLEGPCANAIIAVLEEQGQGLTVIALPKIVIDTLAKSDVVIVPQVSGATPLELLKQASGILNIWVENGGGVLFLHDNVGFGQHPAIFPAIGIGTNNPVLDKVVVAKDHPVTKGLAVNQVFSPAFTYDHIAIKPGPDGEVVIKNERNDAVLVVGKVGQGKVALNGMYPGRGGLNKNDCAGGEKAPTGEELRVLLNTVRWLGEK